MIEIFLSLLLFILRLRQAKKIYYQLIQFRINLNAMDIIGIIKIINKIGRPIC